MRIWSKSDLKWCIHLTRSIFIYFNYLVSVTASGTESPRTNEAQNRSTEGCSKLKRSVDMTSSGKNGLNIGINALDK